MCVAFWALEHPEYALILGTNRDEFLDRPTRAARFHSFEHEADASRDFILSGIDELAGGTWFGLNRTGRIALLTNITEPPKHMASSRGSLVSSFLSSDPSSYALQDYLGTAIPRDAEFAGFNLLLLAPNAPVPVTPSASQLRFDALLVTNGGAGGSLVSRPLSQEERTCGGISNGIDTRGGGDWPKVRHGVEALRSCLANLDATVGEIELSNRLFDILSWCPTGPVTERSQIRNTVQVLPISMNLATGTVMGTGSAPEDSGARHYATRLSSILLIRRTGHVLFVERDVWKLVDNKVVRGDSSSDRDFRFHLDATS